MKEAVQKNTLDCLIFWNKTHGLSC